MVNDKGEIIKKGRNKNPNSERTAIEVKQLEYDASGRACPSQYKNAGSMAEGKSKSNMAAMMELYNLPQIDIDSEEEVENRIRQYFEWVDKWEIKPSISSMALSLGVSRMTLLNWEKGVTRNGQGHFAVIQKAKALITSSVEDNGAEGRVNPVYTMFLLNNSGQGFTNNSRVEIAQEQAHTVEMPNVDDMLETYGISDDDGANDG